ncbi:MAG: hypothetical protein V3T49_01875 [Dehalococcoidia bacterium]
MVERMDTLLESRPVARKNFFGNVAWFLNSNSQMFAGAWGKDVVLRLGQQRAKELIDAGHMLSYDPSGHRPKREYALLLERQHGNDKYLLSWLDVAIKFAEALPDK